MTESKFDMDIMSSSEYVESSSDHQNSPALKRFQCYKCHRTFDKKFVYHHHLKHCSGNLDKKKFICDNCGKGFSRKDNLHRHEKTEFCKREKKIYKCNDCKYWSTRKQNTARHAAVCQQKLERKRKRMEKKLKLLKKNEKMSE